MLVTYETRNGRPGCAVHNYHVLNLGAGVQSTAVYLLFLGGQLALPPLDVAIFADTGEEPSAVYRHLDWLIAQDGPPIWIRQQGVLGDDLMAGENSTGQRFVSVPFFTQDANGKVGRTRRQCSKEYKVTPVDRAIRSELLRNSKGARIKRHVRVHQYFGISLDEVGRAHRIKKRFDSGVSNFTPVFPLVDNEWTRADCIRYLVDRVPHQVPRSACTFCPYRTNAEWAWLRDNDPEGWDRAVLIDRKLREDGVIVNRNMSAKMYAHRSCRPLDEIDFGTEPAEKLDPFSLECEGVCGN